MPLYTYKCEECDHFEDFLHGIEEELPKKHKCPKCGRVKMRRTYQATPVHYSTDFKEENKIKYDQSPSGRKHYY